MPNIKSIATPAAVGFVLSFVISLFSTHKFGTSFLRGIIFSLVFAVLAFAINFIFKHFLDTSESDVIIEESASKKPRINYIIDDENLTEDENPPLFNVASNRTGPSLTKENFSDSRNPEPQRQVSPSPVVPVASAASAVHPDDSSFRPVQLGQPVDSGNATSKATNSQQQVPMSAAEKRSQDRAASVQEIDSLPDIGNLNDDDSAASLSSMDHSDNIISDSDFAQSGVPESSARAALTEGADLKGHDTATIASAIRTLLKKDEM